MNKISRLTNWTAFPSLVLVVLFTIISSFMMRGFLTVAYLSGFIGSYVPLILLAIGQAVVLIAGGIDISVGSVMTLVNVIAVQLMTGGTNPVLAILFALLTSIVVGVVNGVAVGLLRVNPLLVTLSTSTIATGVALMVMPSPGGNAAGGLVSWYQATYLGIPTPTLFVIGLLVLWLLIYRSRVGNQFYAVGENIRNAFVSGVRVRLVQIGSYVFSGFAAGLAGFAFSALTSSGNPTVELSNTLMSIAACVIGGIALSGGIGTVFGAIFGALFLALVFNTVLSANVSAFFQELLSGGIILFSIIAASAQKTLREKMARSSK